MIRRYRVVFEGRIAVDVDAESESAAVKLARSLSEFRSDCGRFERSLLWVIDLTAQNERKAGVS